MNLGTDLKKQSSGNEKSKKVDEEERFKCFMEVEGEQKFAQYAFWCFPITAHFGEIKNILILPLYSFQIISSAKKNVETAKLSYDFGDYDRAQMFTKQAFFYSTLSFVLGISIYFSAIVGGCLYVFLE